VDNACAYICVESVNLMDKPLVVNDHGNVEYNREKTMSIKIKQRKREHYEDIRRLVDEITRLSLSV